MPSSKMAITDNMLLNVEGAGEVQAVLLRPKNAQYLLTLAHGAGAGMNHPFMAALACKLADTGVATLRFQFPYMEQRRKVPDRPPILTETIQAAAEAASKAAPGLPLFSGGKSLGGRMTSLAAAEGRLNKVEGLVFFGFPLHPPNRPGTKRAAHLHEVKVPMLFLQGTRDALADLQLLRPICAELGSRATLHVIEGADHSFHVLKSSGKTDEGVLEELVQTAAEWFKTLTLR
jgi:predicted alpha/beta-hydrolase family hydrolase